MKPLPINHPKDQRGASGQSPTERTIDFLHKLGFEYGSVERRIHRKLTVDFLGIIDMIALTPYGPMGVQSTGLDFAGHLTKLTVTKAQASAKWLRLPGTSLMLIGWRKIKKQRGGKQILWTPRVKMITQDDLIPALTGQGRLDLLQPLPIPEKYPWEAYLD